MEQHLEGDLIWRPKHRSTTNPTLLFRGNIKYLTAQSETIKKRLAAIERDNLKLGLIWAFSFALMARGLSGY